MCVYAVLHWAVMSNFNAYMVLRYSGEYAEAVSAEKTYNM